MPPAEGDKARTIAVFRWEPTRCTMQTMTLDYTVPRVHER